VTFGFFESQVYFWPVKGSISSESQKRGFMGGCARKSVGMGVNDHRLLAVVGGFHRLAAAATVRLQLLEVRLQLLEVIAERLESIFRSLEVVAEELEAHLQKHSGALEQLEVTSRGITRR
jgi:alcohol dehydrogenase class IV